MPKFYDDGIAWDPDSMKSLFDQMVSSGGLDMLMQWYNSMGEEAMNYMLEQIEQQGFSPELLSFAQSYADAFRANFVAAFDNPATGQLYAGEVGTPFDFV